MIQTVIDIYFKENYKVPSGKSNFQSYYQTQVMIFGNTSCHPAISQGFILNDLLCLYISAEVLVIDKNNNLAVIINDAML